MKKLLVLSIVLSALFFSCGNSDKNKEAKKQDITVSESTSNEKTFIKEMSYKDFVKNVWDFETSANEFVFNGSKPCVIDFYATWCGPCKMIAPIMEKLAKEYDGKVDFYKVDCDQEMKLATILQVRNIPMVFFMKEGAQPEKSVGAKDEAYFRSQINKLLGE
ncbi:MAG: thioredoxin [Bacteroidales bacterium]|nr:thioredoxin [Bacteroidales bacterium]